MSIFDVHNSFLTTVRHVAYVQDVLTEELEKAIGIRPTLSVDYWKPENVKLNDGSYFCTKCLKTA